jgi:hypothetical protein
MEPRDGVSAKRISAGPEVRHAERPLRAPPDLRRVEAGGTTLLQAASSCKSLSALSFS